MTGGNKWDRGLIKMLYLAVLTVLVGMVGMCLAMPPGWSATLILRHLVDVVAMFGLNGPATPITGPAPSRGLGLLLIEIARLMAAGVLFGSTARSLYLLAQRRFRTQRFRRLQGHVVVCGSGRGAEALTESLADRGGRDVVWIADRTYDDDAFAGYLARRVHVLHGTPTDIHTLVSAGLMSADHLVALDDRDGVNLEVAMSAVAYRQQHAARPVNALTLHVQVLDSRLVDLATKHDMLSSDADRDTVNFMNVCQSAARLLFRDLDARFGDELVRGDSRLHAVIVGVGRMGQAIGLQLARQAHFAPGRRPLITVVTKRAGQVERNLKTLHPYILEACDLCFLDLDIVAAENLPRLAAAAHGPQDGAAPQDDTPLRTAYFLCRDDDHENLTTALQLVDPLADRDIPIYVRLTQSDSLAQLLEQQDGGDYFAQQIHAFAMPSSIYAADQILDHTLDRIARVKHEAYVAQAAATIPGQQLDAWDRLPVHMKESNRLAADHLSVQLRAVGCTIADVADPRPTVTVFSDSQIDTMAALEHQRWCAERWIAGWAYGPVDDTPARRRCTLLPWDDLSDDAKAKVRDSILAIPDCLDTAAQKVVEIPPTLTGV